MPIYKHLIAGWRVDIAFENEDDDLGMHLLPAYRAFCEEGQCSAPLLMAMTVCRSLDEYAAEELHHVRDCDTGNGITVVHRLADGGYQFRINDTAGQYCALLISSPDFSQCRCMVRGSSTQRSFGLNNALMMAFAFAGSRYATLLVHASVVRHGGKGYAFIAPSGTGKSTQTANWLRVVEDCDLLNDDNPVVRIVDGKAYIYGSPWSGKTPCYRQVCAPLAAITQIDRAAENSVERLGGVMAFGKMLPACSSMKWDKVVYENICDTISQVLASVPVYVLHCTAEPVSAVVCSRAIVKG